MEDSFCSEYCQNHTHTGSEYTTKKWILYDFIYKKMIFVVNIANWG
jgi:hypothetical protein